MHCPRHTLNCGCSSLMEAGTAKVAPHLRPLSVTTSRATQRPLFNVQFFWQSVAPQPVN
jgi:hypothetical protein